MLNYKKTATWITVVSILVVLTFLIGFIPNRNGYDYILALYEITSDMEESEINNYLQDFKTAQEYLAENGIGSEVEKTAKAVLLKAKMNNKTEDDFNNAKLMIAGVLRSTD